MQLLWRGIADYLDAFDVGLMLGCASLPGTDPGPLAQVLSYLHHYHLAPPDVRPRAVSSRFVRTNLMPREQINERQVFRNLPPLLRGLSRHRRDDRRGCGRRSRVQHDRRLSGAADAGGRRRARSVCSVISGRPSLAEAA